MHRGRFPPAGRTIHQAIEPARAVPPAAGLRRTAGEDGPMPTSRFQRTFAAATVACALVSAPAAAQSPPARAADERGEATSVAARLAAIEARLERIAAALEEQAELARLDVIASRVEAGERRLDELEGTRAQARSYLLTLRERRSTAVTVLAEARGRVETGWPPGPREEAVRLHDEAETLLEQLDAEVATQELSVTGLDDRADRLRLEVAAWSALLEAELGPQIPAAEEAEGPAEEPEAAGSVP
jgi:hypothetical protein